ncbi:MAG: phosphoribosylanthranilate isomerase [Spirochaetaceae bacterium]|nr:phosphoribosylanthranilate isomerase [Spirochaetaceae bacterium]
MKIKICGLFRDEDIDAVNEALPDYIGFVFAESRRQVSERTATRLRLKLAKEIIPVGVFVNAPLDDIARLYDENIISIAQLHGDEDDEYIARLKERAALPVIKAVRMGTTAPTAAAPCKNADYILLDSSAAGSGKPFDWSLLSTPLDAVFLAGGINRDNIDEAIRLNPFCIDISSGAETNGMKDRMKIAQLVRRVRRDRKRGLGYGVWGKTGSGF